jgi:LysR family nitrogen assimilation transcriptional regulator
MGMLIGVRPILCESLPHVPAIRYGFVSGATLRAISAWEAHINLRQLAYFIKVVEAGNMTAAADQLKVAQPALGVQMRALENELGVDLLVRHSRGVTPTQAGALLCVRARKIVAEVEAAERELKSLGASKTDNVVLGVPPSLMLQLGPDLLIHARDDMPGVHLSLVEERSVVLLDALNRGQLNIAFCWNVADRPDLERIALLEEDLLLVTAPNVCGEGPVSLAEALTHDLVIAGERGVIRNIVQSEATRLSLTLRLAYEVHSIGSMKALIARGGGATIMPYSLAPKELAEGSLLARRIDRPAITRTLYLVRPAKRSPFSHEDEIIRYCEKVAANLLQACGPYARALR